MIIRKSSFLDTQTWFLSNSEFANISRLETLCNDAMTMVHVLIMLIVG